MLEREAPWRSKGRAPAITIDKSKRQLACGEKEAEGDKRCQQRQQKRTRRGNG
jgi:hypothetical protein